MKRIKVYVVEIPEIGVCQPMLDLSEGLWAMFPSVEGKIEISEFEFKRKLTKKEIDELKKKGSG